MTGALSAVGALLGCIAGGGAVLAVSHLPPLRPVRLGERIAPFLAGTAPPSRLLAPPALPRPFAVLRALFGPTLRDTAGRLDRLVGGASSIRRRLRGLGDPRSVEDYRVEQLAWAAAGMLSAASGTAAIGTLRGTLDPVLIAAAGLAGAGLGVVVRDRALSSQLVRREQAMLAELPVIADLLALAVVAGETPLAALARVCRTADGEIAADLAGALARTRSGTPIARALGDIAEATTVEPLARFLSAIIVATERGTPLADVLRAQALDIRDASNRALLEAGGRKEVAMLLPVVFLILPVTVLFALYPGLLTLTSLSR